MERRVRLEGAQLRAAHGAVVLLVVGIWWKAERHRVLHRPGAQRSTLRTPSESRDARRRRAERVASSGVTLDELKKAVSGGHGGHRAARDRRHGGAAPGQAPDRPALPRRGRSSTAPRAATTCSPSTSTWRRSTGYEMSSWERGYGDFEMKPDLDTLRPIPWHEGTVLRHGRPRVGGRHRGRRLAAADPAPPARPARRARAGSPTPAPSSSSSSSRTPTRRPGSKAYRDLEPANLYNIDYSLLGTARVEPLIRRIRNEMARRRDDGRELEGRVQPRPARDQLPLRRGAAGRRRPRDLQERRQGDRRPGGAWRSPSWRSSTSSRATRATSTARSRDEDGGNAFGDDQQLFDRFVAGQLACMRELTLFFAPHVNSYKRFAKGSFAPDRGRLGPRQPHLLDARRRPRPGAAGREPPAGRRRQPLPGAGRDDRRRACTGSTTSSSSSRRSRATPTTSDKPHVPTQPLRRRATCSPVSEVGARGVRPGGRRPLPEPRPGRARRVRGGGHRLGEVPRLRAAVSARRPVVGICAALERARWARLGRDRGQRSRRAPTRTRGRRGRRACRCCCRPTSDAPPTRRAARPHRRAVLAGGADIDPATYGAEPHPETDGDLARARRASRSRWRRGALEREHAGARRSAAGCRS